MRNKGDAWLCGTSIHVQPPGCVKTIWNLSATGDGSFSFMNFGLSDCGGLEPGDCAWFGMISTVAEPDFTII